MLLPPSCVIVIDMRVTAEVGYLNNLKDAGSIFIGGYVEHVQAYLSRRDKSHRKKETYYPSSKVREVRKDENGGRE